MSSRPSFKYEPRYNAWMLRGKEGKLVAKFPDENTGGAIAQRYTRIGSSAAVDVGSTMVVASIPFTGVAAGDIVSAVPKGSLPAGLFVGGFRVSGADNVNAYVGNLDDATAASLPAIGWDVTIERPI